MLPRACALSLDCANCLQMWDLKENIENEVQSAHEAYLKMEAHIAMYVNEMEQSM